MANENVIGGVKVEITGDYSQLEQDFSAAVDIASSAGVQISDALQATGSAGLQTEQDLSNLFGIEFDQRAVDAGGAIDFAGTSLKNFDADAIIAQREAENLASSLQNLDGTAYKAGDAEQHAAEAAAQLGEQEAGATTKTAGFVSEIGALGLAMAGVAAAFVAAGVEAVSLVSEFGSAARETQNLADRLDLTWQETRTLQDMAELAGVSLNSLQVASFRLATALEDSSGAGKKVAEALNSIGVTGETSGELLRNLLVTLSQIPDATERIAVAHQVLGRASNQLLPLIKNYGALQEAITQLGPVLDNDMATKLIQAQQNVAKLDIAWTRFKEQLAVGIAPVLTGFLEELTKAASGLSLLGRAINEGKLGWADFGKAALAALSGGPAAAAAVLADQAAKAGLSIKGLGVETTKTGQAFDTGTNKVKEHYKAIKEMSDGMAVLVAQEKLEEQAHQAVIKETAEFNELMGTNINGLEYMAIKTAAATLAFDDFKLAEAKAASESDTVGDDAAKLAGTMGLVADQIQKSQQAALDTSSYKKLEDALNSLGIKGLQYYKDQAEKADASFKAIEESGDATYNELAQAALKASQAEIEAAIASGKATKEEYADVLAQIQKDLDDLDASHVSSAKNRVKTEKDLGDQIQQINKRTFDSLEKGLATDIVQQKGWAATIKDLWQHLAEDLLNIMFKVLLDPLEKALGNILGGIFGGGGSAAGSATGGAASAAGSAAGGAGSVAGSVGSAVGSGITGILGTAFSGISAITSVLSFLGLGSQGHMESDLQKIEESTRYLKIGVVTQGDSIFYSAAVTRDTLLAIKDYFWDTQATYLQGISVKLDTIIGFGGFGGGSGSHAASSAAIAGAMVVNIDMSGSRISGGMTDTQITGILNRGVRNAKLAGAFRPGTWPQ